MSKVAAAGVAPSGWEATVKGMTSCPGIDNPLALSHWMNDQGMKPEDASDPLAAQTKFKLSPNYQQYATSYPAPQEETEEANAGSSLGQLMRPGKESRRIVKLAIRFRESMLDEAKREIEVDIIEEGMGNAVDRHVYSAALLEKIAANFSGIKAYANHPSKTEERDRPERSIRDIIGYYKEAKAAKNDHNKTVVRAILKVNEGESYTWAWDLVKEAVAYAKQFPGKQYVGISINAWGVSHVEESNGEKYNVVDDLTDLESADIVTQAGAGGKFLGATLREAIKKLIETKGGIMKTKLVKETAAPGAAADPAPLKGMLSAHHEALKGLREAFKKDPAHEAAFGQTGDELVNHSQSMLDKHKEMYEGAGGAAGAPGAQPGNDSPTNDAVDEAAKKKAIDEQDFEKMQKLSESGKLSATEKTLFEALLKGRSEARIKENAQMIERLIDGSGIPEAYRGDLKVLALGKSEPEVKTLVESRKKFVESIVGDRGAGAGAGSGGGSHKTETKLAEALKSSGIPMKEVKA